MFTFKDKNVNNIRWIIEVILYEERRLTHFFSKKGVFLRKLLKEMKKLLQGRSSFHLDILANMPSTYLK